MNRLTSITNPNHTQSLYFYDPLSRLIAEQTDNNTLLYLYDKTQEVGAINLEGVLLELKVMGLVSV